MSNQEMKRLIKESRCFYYEIAEKLDISESSFSKWFRKELTEEQVTKITEAVKQIVHDSKQFE